MLPFIRSHFCIFLLLVFASILLSGFAIYIDPVINNDGAMYISVAKLVASDSWFSAFDYYSWPFYSFVISATAQILTIEPESAAYVLSIVFATLLCLAFVCIIQELSSDQRRTIMIAAVVILLFPTVNKYRPYITRDFAYLACYLWSLYYLLRFAKDQNHKAYFYAWLILSIASAFFRLEGLLFSLLIPFILVYRTSTRPLHRKLSLVALIGFAILMSLALIVWFSSTRYASLLTMITNPDLSLTELLKDTFTRLLSYENGEDTVHTLNNFLHSVGKVFYEVIRRLAVFYFIFAVYAYIKKWIPGNPLSHLIIRSYIAINFLVLCLFALVSGFFVSRYTAALVLTLLLFTPFFFDHLLQGFKQKSRSSKLSILALGLILALISIEGLDLRTDKHYIKSAGQWIAENSDETATVYSNNRLLVYYAKRNLPLASYNNAMMLNHFQTGSIYDYDLLAYKVNISVPVALREAQTMLRVVGKPIKIIDGSEDDKIFIFDLQNKQ